MEEHLTGWVRKPTDQMSNESENKYEIWTEPVKTAERGYGMVIAVTLAMLIIVAAVGITVAILSIEEKEYVPSKTYTAVMTDVKVLLSLDTYEVDYGKDEERLNYEVYWDDENTGEFEVGNLCAGWDRYENSDANIEQTINKVCRINIENLEHQVGLTACLYHEDEQYDIYSGDSEYGSCVLWQDVNVKPDMGYTFCSSALGGTKTNTVGMKSTSGLDDNDDNQYNGKVTFSYTLEYTYDCVEG